MALYTSYFTRQLALRPEALQGEQREEEGAEKTLQKAVGRRTVDYTAPFLNWFEVGACLGAGEAGVGRTLLGRTVLLQANPAAAATAPPQARCLVRSPLDAPALQASASAALGLLPPEAYAHQPASGFATKFAAQAPSKAREKFERGASSLWAGAGTPTQPFPAMQRLSDPLDLFPPPSPPCNAACRRGAASTWCSGRPTATAA